MGLSFGTPLFLYALPLALLPLLAHLRARRKLRFRSFPGTYFLQDPASPAHERSRKLEDFSLLCLRTLLLLAAILLLASPQLSGGNPWLGQSVTINSTPLVVVVDDSPSMQRNCPLLQETLLALKRTLKKIKRPLAMVSTSGQTVNFQAIPAFDPDNLPALFQQLPHLSGSRPRALNSAVELLRRYETDSGSVLLLTDFCSNGEERDGLEGWQKALTPFGPNAPYRLNVHQLQQTLERQWAIQPLQHDGFAIIGTPVEIAFEVHAVKGSGVRRLTVEIADFPQIQARDAQIVLDRQLNLQDGASTQIRFQLLRDQIGDLFVTARLSPEDDDPQDDQYSTVLRFIPKPKYLLWDLRKRSSSMDDQLLPLLRKSLSPFANDPTRNIQIELFDMTELPDLDRVAALVVLYRPQAFELNPQQAMHLRSAIERGTTAIFMPDISGDLPVVLDVSDPLLPLTLERFSVQELGWQLQLSKPVAPFLQAFIDGRNGNLESIPILNRLLSSTNLAAGEVLMRFQDGLPALAAKNFVRGRVIQFAFGLDRQLDGLTFSAAWPILLHRLLHDSAARMRLHPGYFCHSLKSAYEPLHLELEPAPVNRKMLLRGPYTTAQSDLSTSNTHWEQILPRNAKILHPSGLTHPGHYRLQLTSVPDNRQEYVWLTLHRERIESEYRLLPVETLQWIKNRVAVNDGYWTDTAHELESALHAGGKSASCAPLLWALFCMAMFIELCVLLYRGRSA